MQSMVEVLKDKEFLKYFTVDIRDAITTYEG